MKRFLRSIPIILLALTFLNAADAQTIESNTPHADSEFVWCANEGGTCAFADTKQVKFGSGDKWTFKTFTGGTPCTVQAFDGVDPWPNWGKMCLVGNDVAPPPTPAPTPVPTPVPTPMPPSPTPTQDSFTWCANEGGTCSFNGTKQVKFGSGDKWTFKTFTGGTPCTLQAFDGVDPWPGWGKMCFVGGDVVPPPAPTPAATPVATPTPLPSSLVKIGVYEGSINVAGIQAHEDWLGRKMDFANDTIPSDSTWDAMVYNSFVWYFANNWSRYGSEKVVVTIPMIPTFGKYDGPSLSPAAAARALQDGADGAYDAYWIRMRDSLIETGYTKNFIRLGWEPNGNWYNWAAGTNPTAWVSYYKRIVGIIRADMRIQNKFVWNPTTGAVVGSIDVKAEDIYPGDDVVDVIGIDVYDSDWSKYNSGTQASEALQKDVWQNTILNGDHGLSFFGNFARLHKKPIHIAEWGCIRASEHGGGDNPYYVMSLWNWAHTPSNNVTLLMLFDEPKLTSFPNASTLYKSLVTQ